MPATFPLLMPITFSGGAVSGGSLLSEWYVSDPGVRFGRVADDSIEGDFVFAMGGVDGVDIFAKPGDRFDIFQSEDPGAAKIVRFTARLRGPDTMPALSGAEPFVLADGQNLTVAIDGGSNQTVTFSAADFAAIGAATAKEVARVLNRDLSGCRARLTGTDEIALFSLTTGRRSRVRVIGGTAALGFTELVWRAVLLIDSVEAAAEIIRNGVSREPLDFAANLSAYGTPIELRVRLEVIRA